MSSGRFSGLSFNMEKQTQTSEHNTCFIDILGEHIKRVICWLTIGSYLFATIAPAPAMAVIDGLIEGEALILEVDKHLKESKVISLSSLNDGEFLVDLVVPPSLIQNSTLGEGSVITVMARAYSSTPGQTDSSPNVTASGNLVGREVIAANFLPFGTRVKIGQQLYTVWDRMNGRYDSMYVIDLWQPSVEEARQYGVRRVMMEIVEIPEGN